MFPLDKTGTNNDRGLENTDRRAIAPAEPKPYQAAHMQIDRDDLRLSGKPSVVSTLILAGLQFHHCTVGHLRYDLFMMSP